MALSVVYAVDTGHVVGALALTGTGAGASTATGAPADAVALVGDALPLRVSLGEGRMATLPLDARELAVAAVDDEPGALAEPLAFGVATTAEGKKPKPALVRLASWTDGVALAGDGLTVTVKVAATLPTPVVALVSDEQNTHVLAGEIPAQQTEVKLPLTLAAGSVHGVLVLAAGWAGYLGTEKVT